MSFQSFVLSHLAIAPVCNTKKLPINKPELFAYRNNYKFKVRSYLFLNGEGPLPPAHSLMIKMTRMFVFLVPSRFAITFWAIFQLTINGSKGEMSQFPLAL